MSVGDLAGAECSSYPVKGHVAGVLEDVVVRVAHDINVAMARGAWRAKGTKSVLCMVAITGHSCFNLFECFSHCFQKLWSFQGI